MAVALAGPAPWAAPEAGKLDRELKAAYSVRVPGCAAPEDHFVPGLMLLPVAKAVADALAESPEGAAGLHAFR